jgi:hypothetical protein
MVAHAASTFLKSVFALEDFQCRGCEPFQQVGASYPGVAQFEFLSMMPFEAATWGHSILLPSMRCIQQTS